MMNLNQIFQYCFRCGGEPFSEKAPRYFQCDRCSFGYYINTATAVAGIVTDEEWRILLIRRGRDPGKGKFSIPGGFVDPDETAEEALRREMQEELSLEISSMEYLCSFPDPYEYKGVVYPVLDLVFVCRADSFASMEASEEAEEPVFIPVDEIRLEEIAFPSIRKALEFYRRRN